MSASRSSISDRNMREKILGIITQRGHVGTQTIITMLRRQLNVSPRDVDRVLREMRTEQVVIASGPQDRLSYTLGMHLTPITSHDGEITDADVPVVDGEEPALVSSVGAAPELVPDLACSICGTDDPDAFFPSTVGDVRSGRRKSVFCRDCQTTRARERRHAPRAAPETPTTQVALSPSASAPATDLLPSTASTLADLLGKAVLAAIGDVLDGNPVLTQMRGTVTRLTEENTSLRQILARTEEERDVALRLTADAEARYNALGRRLRAVIDGGEGVAPNA